MVACADDAFVVELNGEAMMRLDEVDNVVENLVVILFDYVTMVVVDSAVEDPSTVAVDDVKVLDYYYVVADDAAGQVAIEDCLNLD